jgi:acyl-CoA thioesterase-1
MPGLCRMTALAFAACVLGALGLGGCAASVAEPDLRAPSPASAEITALFLGDSYTEGTGLTPDQVPLRWSTGLAQQMGWREVNAGCNGSGYTRPGLRCGNTYEERVALLTDPVPDVVVVSGGVNDLGASRERITAGVNATYATLRETFPHATIYAVGGIYYTGDARPELLQFLNDAVEAAAEREDALFIDIGEPLLGRPELMAVDGLHPNAEGHAVIKDLILAALDE